MVRLKWDVEDSPMYQAGVSQGVFYGDDGVGHAWSGLISVTEKPQANAPTSVYNAVGQKYDIFGNVAEKKHGLACYIYPEIMDEYLGYEYLEVFGFTVDERPPKKFHMAYRVELGDGLYEIHVLLNQIATFGETARQTISSIMSPSTITMNLEGAVDPRIGTSHIVLDSRTPLTQSAEVLLFGDEYTDANINDFLAAEPVWETVAANYAPIIEPDYDNYVWLGGDNLIRRDEEIVGSMIDGDGYVNIHGIPRTSTMLDYIEVSPGEQLFLQKNTSTAGDQGGGYFRYSWHDADEVYLYRVASASNRFSITVPDDAYLLRISYPVDSYPKLERYYHTAWTPSNLDSNQEPRTHDPYPENYRPGIKNSSNWLYYNGPIEVFYDEDRKGLGLYSKTTFESLNTYSDIYWDDITPHISIKTIPGSIQNGRPVYAKAKVTLVDPLSDLISSRYATIGVGHNGPTAESPPNTRGESDLYVLNDRLQVPVGSTYDSIRLYHGGSLDTQTVTFTDILISPLSQELTFFDVNSKPPAKGIRYKRVSTPYGDYTIRQELRLRV